jgi:hypothetical protein
MATKCEKRGCEQEALNTLRFTDLVYRNVDADYPVVLCKEHTRQVRRFDKSDVGGVKKWLNDQPIETNE